MGLPLVGAQLAQIAIFATDVAMVGRLGEEALAAVTLGGQLIFLVLIISAGFSIAIIPLAAEALAKNDNHTLRRTVQAGVWQAAILSLLLLPWLYASEFIFNALGQNPVAASIGSSYVKIALWSLPFALLINVLRSYFSALEYAATLLIVSLMGVAVNFAADYALVFGRWGMPALGSDGAAAASVITNAAMFFALLVVAIRLRASKACGLFSKLNVFDRSMFVKLFWMGLPISMSLVAEVGMFQVATLMIGTFSISELAAHGVVMQLATIVFMVPLGFSQMVSIRAANAKGSDDADALKLVATSAVALALCFSVFSALLFLTIPEILISLYLDFDLPEADDVLAFAVPMLFAAAAFQLVDGAQAIAMGVLRGIQDIRVPSFYAVLCYWGVGVSTSYLLGFVFGWRSVGVWVGLAAGLVAAAILFWGRLLRRHL